MLHIRSPRGITVSYDKYGSGPALLVVHGGFSDHVTNWGLVKPLLERRFTVYAMARRGRGETDATIGHGVEDEARDVAALIEAIPEPVFLLGHSYGAQCALAAALPSRQRVRKLVLYEPPRTGAMTTAALSRLEGLAAAESWSEFAAAFFIDTLHVPAEDVAQLRQSAQWAAIAADAKASLGDLRAINRYEFNPRRFRDLRCPVLLQIGSESPRKLYATDQLAAQLPDARIEVLEGQAHEGMTTAPEMYAAAVERFLLGLESAAPMSQSKSV